MSSYFKSPIGLLALATSVSRLVPALLLGSLAVLLLLLVLGLATPHLAFLALRTFKRVLSDESLHHYSISLIELLYLFPPLSLLPNKTDRKRTFDIAFINSCQLAGNHA